MVHMIARCTMTGQSRAMNVHIFERLLCLSPKSRSFLIIRDRFNTKSV
jgi:hypothetical protein